MYIVSLPSSLVILRKLPKTVAEWPVFHQAMGSLVIRLRMATSTRPLWLALLTMKRTRLRRCGSFAMSCWSVSVSKLSCFVQECSLHTFTSEDMILSSPQTYATSQFVSPVRERTSVWCWETWWEPLVACQRIAVAAIMWPSLMRVTETSRRWCSWSWQPSLIASQILVVWLMRRTSASSSKHGWRRRRRWIWPKWKMVPRARMLSHSTCSESRWQMVGSTFPNSCHRYCAGTHTHM